MTVYFQTTFILHYVGKNTALKNGYFKLNPLNLCVCVCVQAPRSAEDVLNKQICQQVTVHPENQISHSFASYRFLFMSV